MTTDPTRLALRLLDTQRRLQGDEPLRDVLDRLLTVYVHDAASYGEMGTITREEAALLRPYLD